MVFLCLVTSCKGSSPPASAHEHNQSPADGKASFSVVTTALHPGYIHEVYEGVMSAEGGQPPYTWSITSGELPRGLSLNRSKGSITGKPLSGGHYPLAITATDSSGKQSSKSFRLTIADQPLDPYGGLMNMRSPHGGTGHFRVEKFGNRWMFVTPDGDAFWMLGVYGVTPGDSGTPKDETGVSYYNRIVKKYGDHTLHWGPQANRRLKSWGFNTIGPYSYYFTYPTLHNNGWPGGTQPVKMPFVLIENVSQYAETNTHDWAPGPTKSLYRGVKQSVYDDGGDFPDVFDPNFDAYVESAFTRDVNGIVTALNSPWLIGAIIDDTDYLRGFGAGADFPTDPPGQTSAHLGWITLVTAPTQTTNPFTRKPYQDTKVYTKYALRDFLKNKYHTIAALNAAWGSNYTTFGSDGGWGTGRGLLDEDGRHSWVGRDPYGLSKTQPAVKADLDAFLYQIAAKYYSTICTRLKEHAPHLLYFGPSVTGAWHAPARRQILEAAGKYVDVLSTNMSTRTPGQLDFVAKYFGDKPIIYWEGMYANPDSGRWRHPNPNPRSHYACQTQAERGRMYTEDLDAYANTVASPTGSIPSVGLLFWDMVDSLGEQTNWGLVSCMDNAYDGKEATISGGVPGVFGSAKCRDPWGYPCGGEERNYGDFLDPVTKANLSIMDSIVATYNKQR